MNKGKIVLAYSGGLDTSCCVKWLRDKGYQVICFTADLGQGGYFRSLKKKAMASGASKIYIKDLRSEFIRDFVWPALKAHACYEGRYLLATALGRPLIAKYLVEIAHKEKAGCIAHGCTGKGNDQVRIEVTSRILAPHLKIIAPLRVWEFVSREQELAYAKTHGIPVEATRKKPYSIDTNLWGVSIECGVLEDPRREPPEDAYLVSHGIDKTPRKGVYLVIRFKKGIPVALNGKEISPLNLLKTLNRIGGEHGVGRTDLIEDRLIGIKSREVYEAPAAWILYTSHRELESLVLDRELLHFKERVAQVYSQLIYNGLWYSPLKRALDAFINATQQVVTGEVRIRLCKGNIIPVGRTSPHSLYKRTLATYTHEDEFDRSLAEGFIKAWGLPYQGTLRDAQKK